MKYDKEYELQIQNKKPCIGVINGNNTILMIIPGFKSDIYGYNQRYLKLARKINTNYGVTVVISSNHFELENPIIELIDFIKKELTKDEKYNIYYFGFSKGGTIGAQYGTFEKKIKRMVLVNTPLMINYHKTKDGIARFEGERMTFVYGSLDPSYKFSELITLEHRDNIKLQILDQMDHNVKDEEVFLSLLDNTLFF